MEADAAGQLEDVERGGGRHPGLQGSGWDFEEDLTKTGGVKSIYHQVYPGSWTNVGCWEYSSCGSGA